MESQISSLKKNVVALLATATAALKILLLILKTFDSSENVLFNS
jgi:hypothetical protein